MSADPREQALRRLLQREEIQKLEAERAAGTGLRSVMGRIDQFLQAAADAPPPACLEVHDSEELTEEEHELRLNVVAGVLEAREAVPLRSVTSTSGRLLLPTADNEAALDAQRLRESQAMLNLFSSLCGRQEAASGNRQRKEKRGVEAAEAEEDGEDACSTSSSEVDIMDASSLSDDEDEPPRKRLITEL